MLKTELREIIANGENSGVEFKRDDGTVEKMIAGLRYSRNTVLMETMRDYGYVDHRGMGIRSKVLPLLKAHKHPEPSFEATEDHLKTTLYRKRAP